MKNGTMKRLGVFEGCKYKLIKKEKDLELISLQFFFFIFIPIFHLKNSKLTNILYER